MEMMHTCMGGKASMHGQRDSSTVSNDQIADWLTVTQRTHEYGYRTFLHVNRCPYS